jgi:biotin carboxyl carrier protein
MAKVTLGGRSYDVEVRGEMVVVDGQEFSIKQREDNDYVTVISGGVGYRVQLPAEAERVSGMQVQIDYRPFIVEIEGRPGGGPAPREARSVPVAAAPRAGVKGGVSAAIAGRVLKVKVAKGDTVAQGHVLLLLEAMKMENEIKATAAGTVTEILVAEGDRVSEGQTLIVIG